MVSENVKNDEKKKKEKKKKSRQNTRVPVAGLLVAKLFHSACSWIDSVLIKN